MLVVVVVIAPVVELLLLPLSPQLHYMLLLLLLLLLILYVAGYRKCKSLAVCSFLEAVCMLPECSEKCRGLERDGAITLSEMELPVLQDAHR